MLADLDEYAHTDAELNDGLDDAPLDDVDEGADDLDEDAVHEEEEETFDEMDCDDAEETEEIAGSPTTRGSDACHVAMLAIASRLRARQNTVRPPPVSPEKLLQFDDDSHIV